ncbi:FAD-dependent oxidoreductase, partial [Pseudomonas sp. MPR-AND1A]|uniref:FAD-dependent oxidoreductase n=1 Tax=Pseudomonas sp. MPR-AND1A TaxID=2070600 RepID=UPI0034D1D06A
MQILTSVKVCRVDARNGRQRVAFEHGGKECAIEADRIVNGAGRVANVEGLDLEAGHVRHRNGRIETDAYLRSASNPAVYI